MKIIIVKQNILFLLKKKKKAKYSLILFIKISVCFRSTCGPRKLGQLELKHNPVLFFFRGCPRKARGSCIIECFCKIRSKRRQGDFLHPSTKRRKITCCSSKTMCYHVPLSASVLENHTTELSQQSLNVSNDVTERRCRVAITLHGYNCNFRVSF